MNATETEVRHLVVLEEALYAELRQTMGADWSLETAAFLLAYAVGTPGGGQRLLVRELLVPPAEAYEERTRNRLTLSAAYMASVYQQARSGPWSVLQIHSHPDGSLRPSDIDLAGEQSTLPRLRYHAPQLPHGRLIITPNDLHARIFLPDRQEEALHVQVLGTHLTHVNHPGSAPNGLHDRQVRAFREEGQAQLRHTRFAVIGVGGTGSLVAQQLAHLGAQQVRLYDPDLLEESNLNRVVGATPQDLGRPKVDIAAEMMQRIQPSITVETVQADITAQSVARTLLDMDFVLACTDSQGSRAVLSQLAYQFLLPVIDVGVSIYLLPDGRVQIPGRVQMLSPGLPCMLCTFSLDEKKVREDLMTENARAADPYVRGIQVPDPAVISINSMAAGTAVTMMLAAVTGFPVAARYILLQVESSKVKTPVFPPFPECSHCSPEGARGRGDTWAAPGKLA